ncbi:MAG TPA: energy transducer TonB [Candidatus Acidoferrum sp.]|jgi:hypothetical protein
MSKPARIFLLLLLAAPFAHSQENPDLRREAIQLLEHAHAVSTSPDMLPSERIDTFRILDATSGPREGTFRIVKIRSLGGTREDISFGDFNTVDIWTPAGLSTNRKSETLPGDVMTVRAITPMYLLHFGEEDVIQAVTDKAGNGHPVRCVEFNTIKGLKRENNEFCFDPANGTLVTERIGDEAIENSDFVPFAGALFPSKIVYSLAAKPRIEISQTIQKLQPPIESYLTPPEGSATRPFCKSFRRPIPVSMPQPKPGNGSRDIDVQLQGVVGRDGKIHEPVVQTAETDALAKEALALINQWTFTPPVCNGEPSTAEVTLVVHFHGQ